MLIELSIKQLSSVKNHIMQRVVVVVLDDTQVMYTVTDYALRWCILSQTTHSGDVYCHRLHTQVMSTVTDYTLRWCLLSQTTHSGDVYCHRLHTQVMYTVTDYTHSVCNQKYTYTGFWW